MGKMSNIPKIKENFCECGECGGELVTDWEWIYEGNTRRKKYRKVCSEFPCKHSGHTYGSSCIEGNYFVRECDRCGKIEKDIIIN